MNLTYAQIDLTLDSDLHIGAGRAGMLAKTHPFVPGHIVSNALATVIGKAQGGQYTDFQQALLQVQETTRCGPLFLQDPAHKNPALLPVRDQQIIEQQFLNASTHVTLHSDTRSHVAGALFEVEAISATVVRGDYQGQATQFMGGLWFNQEKIGINELAHWLTQCLLGGELKSGLGRVRDVQLIPEIAHYAGFGKVDGKGLHLSKKDILPGVALDGVSDTPFYPWVGRLYDKQKGFGRLLSEAAFVAYDASVSESACFLPSAAKSSWGCWQHIAHS